MHRRGFIDHDLCSVSPCNSRVRAPTRQSCLRYSCSPTTWRTALYALCPRWRFWTTGSNTRTTRMFCSVLLFALVKALSLYCALPMWSPVIAVQARIGLFADLSPDVSISCFCVLALLCFADRSLLIAVHARPSFFGVPRLYLTQAFLLRQTILFCAGHTTLRGPRKGLPCASSPTSGPALSASPTRTNTGTIPLH